MNESGSKPVKAGTKYVVGYVRDDGKFIWTTEHRSEKAATKMLAWNKKNCATSNHQIRPVS